MRSHIGTARGSLCNLITQRAFIIALLPLVANITACGDSKDGAGAGRMVESVAERTIGYTPERQTEYASLTDCITAVIKFEAQREVVNSVCGAIFDDGIKATPAFRKNLLCLRHELINADNFQQARDFVRICAKDFPSEDSSLFASQLMIDQFPTSEQQQINQLKAQNQRLEHEQRLKEINQEYRDRMAEINARAAINRPMTCVTTGSIVTCN